MGDFFFLRWSKTKAMYSSVDVPPRSQRSALASSVDAPSSLGLDRTRENPFAQPPNAPSTRPRSTSARACDADRERIITRTIHRSPPRARTRVRASTPSERPFLAVPFRVTPSRSTHPSASPRVRDRPFAPPRRPRIASRRHHHSARAHRSIRTPSSSSRAGKADRAARARASAAVVSSRANGPFLRMSNTQAFRIPHYVRICTDGVFMVNVCTSPLPGARRRDAPPGRGRVVERDARCSSRRRARARARSVRSRARAVEPPRRRAHPREGRRRSSDGAPISWRCV